MGNALGVEYPEARQSARIQRRSPIEEETQLVNEMTARTWESLKLFFRPETGFPADRLRLLPAEIVVVPQTKPTNIGLGIMSLLAAERGGFLSSAETDQRLHLLLNSLKKIERSNGFFYDWYHASTGEKLTKWPSNGKELNLFLSSVDNAWLALTLLIAQKAKPELAGEIQTAFLNGMDFEFFFNQQTKEFRGGYSVTEEEPTAYSYSREYLSEPRILYWVHAALCQDQKKKQKILAGLLNREGKVPDHLYGGALFELLMPRLFIREQYLDAVVKKIFDQHRAYGDLHLDGLVGISVADDPSHENYYEEMGVGGIYPSKTVLSSHGMALALLADPELALRSLRKMQQVEGFYGSYGCVDAVDVKTGAVTDTQVFINQAMVFLSLLVYTNNHFVTLFETYFNRSD